MENRAYALAAGLFVLALGAGLVAAAVWLSGYHVERKPYVLVSRSAVSGLNPQSTAFLRGVPAGTVESIGFDPDDVRNILVRIQVDSDLPITRGTYATLRLQGITGLTQVELEDAGDDPVPLPTSADRLGRIPMRPSLTDRLTDAAADIFPALKQLAAQLNALFSTDNRDHFQKVLAHTEAATAGLLALEQQISDVLQTLPALGADSRRTLQRIDGLVSSLDGLAATMRQLAMNADRLSLTGQTAGEELVGSTLPRIDTALEQLTRTTQDLQGLVRELRQDPQSLLLGPQHSVPGPGEPGYVPPREGRRR